MTSLKRYLLLSGVVLSLAACSTGPGVDEAHMSAITTNINAPYYVNAGSVSVESRYNPLADPKDISGTLATPLDTAVREYARNRFRAAGSEGVFHVIVEDASVFLDHNGSSSGMGRFMGLGNEDKYTAIVKLGLFRDSSSVGPGAMGTTLRAQRSVTMSENVSLEERDAKLKEFVTELLGDLDKGATDAILNSLKLSAPQGDIAPSPGPYPPTPVETTPIR
jgi:hypothetical protein